MTWLWVAVSAVIGGLLFWALAERAKSKKAEAITTVTKDIAVRNEQAQAEVVAVQQQADAQIAEAVTKYEVVKAEVQTNLEVLATSVTETGTPSDAITDLIKSGKL